MSMGYDTTDNAAKLQREMSVKYAAAGGILGGGPSPRPPALKDFHERLAVLEKRIQEIANRLSFIADETFGPVPEVEAFLDTVNGRDREVTFFDRVTDLERAVSRLDRTANRF